MPELHRFLGNTGLKVSRYCFGTMTLGTKWLHVGPPMSQKEADVLVQFLALWCGHDGGYGYPATLEEVYGYVRKGELMRRLPDPHLQSSL